MKIGVFLAYGPKTILGKEGLGRYIGGLIKGFHENGQDVTVLIPRWSLDTVNDLFGDYGIPTDSVELSVLEKEPAIWGLYTLLSKKRKLRGRGLKYRIIRTLADWGEFFVGRLVKVTNLLLLLLVGIVCAIFALVLLPLFIIVYLGYVVLQLCKKIAKKGARQDLKSLSQVIKNVFAVASKKVPIKEVFKDNLFRSVNDMLVAKANRLDVDVWFVPTLFWPEVKDLKQCHVISVPDVVTTSFPMDFADVTWNVKSTEKCISTITENENFITYCEYVNRNLLQKQLCKNGKVIYHASNCMDRYITIGGNIEKRLNATKNFTNAFCQGILKTLWTKSPYNREGIAEFNFEDVHYIFFASQMRPYKNILNLIKAYEELLRNRYINIKLVLTCDLKYDPLTYEYVWSHGLQFDVISFYNVSAQELAALYRCADLVVNPSLYEGGFPFTFCEGMSVGTPSIMSDIPQVREVVSQYGLIDSMLFNPHDYIAIADKIEYALNNIPVLVEKEQSMFDDLSKRSFKLVAKEYVDAFAEFKSKN